VCAAAKNAFARAIGALQPDDVDCQGGIGSHANKYSARVGPRKGSDRKV
jgi:hypothetical protein